MTDTRLLHTVGVRALEWLWAHRDGFRLEADVDPEVGFLERFKPVGELALICRVLFREGVAGSQQAELARRLVDHTWRHTLDGGRMLARGQRIEPLTRPVRGVPPLQGTGVQRARGGARHRP